MKLTIRNKKNWYSITILGIIFSLLNLIVLFIFYTMLFESQSLFRIEDIIMLLLLVGIFILFDVYLLNSILWQLNGYEVVEMNNRELIIHKKGKIVRNKFIISTSEIEKIEIQEYLDVAFGNTIFINISEFSKILGESGGRIKVTYSGKTIDFGRSLSDKEALYYVEQMINLLHE